MKITPKYFEDFEVGYSFETKPTLISKEEIMNVMPQDISSSYMNYLKQL